MDLVIRDGYITEQDRVVDIGVRGEKIADIADEIGDRGDKEIDANGNLVSPGFVDCHLHIDKAFNASGQRFPRGCGKPYDQRPVAELEEAYFAEASTEDVTRNAIRNVQMAVASGTTYIRNHINLNPETYGLQNVEASIEARDRTANIADMQLVVGGRSSIEDGGNMMAEAIERCKEGTNLNSPTFVGGGDPATGHNDIETTFNRWFSIGEELNVDLDIHIQDKGTLGIYTLERFISYAREYGYENRVTASHCFALSHIPEYWLDDVIAEIKDVGMNVVTCYQSTRPEMPMQKLLSEDVVIGGGTDNDRDFVFPHGNADLVEAALVWSLKLHGDWPFVEDYRWFDTIDGLWALWDLITENGAKVFGIEDTYGIEVGNPANLVVFDEPSPHWAIISQDDRPYVIKDGNVVARDGELLPEYRIVDDYRDVSSDPIRS